MFFKHALALLLLLLSEPQPVSIPAIIVPVSITDIIFRFIKTSFKNLSDIRQ